MDYSIQLYSLYDLTDKDLEGVLRTVAEIGYKSVEFAGYFGHSAETIRGWLDKYGLTCSGTHTVYPAIMQDFEGQVAFHKTLGTTEIIIPGFRFTTEAELDAFIDFANEYGPKLAAEGLRLSFHNHSKEFIPTEYGKIVEINAGSYRTRPSCIPNCIEVARLCAKYGVPLVLSSDAHFAGRVGDIADSVRIVKEANVPQELILNADPAAFAARLEKRTGRTFDL